MSYPFCSDTLSSSNSLLFIYFPLSGWNVLYGAPTNASCSTLCSIARRSLKANTATQENVWGARPQKDGVTAAERRQQRIMETAQVINIVTRTATQAEIRGGTEIRTDVTDTETTGTGGMPMDRKKRQSRMNKDGALLLWKVPELKLLQSATRLESCTQAERFNVHLVL